MSRDMNRIPEGRNSKNNCRKLVVFELNEVPYKVWDYFVSLKKYSNTARLLRLSAQYTVKTPDATHLHPKISWQTFHRGVPDSTHGIIEYNDVPEAVDEQYPQIWDILRKNGISVGIGASIGSYPIPATRENIDFYLPDPFALAPEAKPKKLELFQQFNLGAVHKSGRVVRRGTNKKQALQLLLNAPMLGISPRTMMDVVLQIVIERLNKRRIVRRRTIQAQLSFDVVFAQIRRTQPDFATLFSNHVASSMHRYWAATFPEDYVGGGNFAGRNSNLEQETTENRMPPEWINAYRDEIPFAMSRTDRMLGALMNFVDRHPEYCLLVMTTMGQRAARAVPVRSQVIVEDFSALMAALGFDSHEWQRLPGMEPVYGLKFVSDHRFNAFNEQLSRTTVCGQPVQINKIDAAGCRIFFSLKVRDVEQDEFVVRVGNAFKDPGECGLRIEPIQDMAPSTGWHTPFGSAIFYDPQRPLSAKGGRSIVDSTAFTAAILDHFGIKRPNYMPKPPAELTACMAGRH